MSKHKDGNATRQEASLAQAIFWKPDLNNGVRMSIRRFAAADVLLTNVKVKWKKDCGKNPAGAIECFRGSGEATRLPVTGQIERI